MDMHPRTDAIIARFHERYEPDPAGCWLWTGGRNRGGDGTLSVVGATFRAHRLSYELHVGPIPEGMHVCHTCDVPGCVNPEHLFLGTHAENMEDCRRKNRNRFLRGEEHGQAKLTEAGVQEILAARQETGRALARRFGVAETTISAVRCGRGWGHVASDHPDYCILEQPLQQVTPAHGRASRMKAQGCATLFHGPEAMTTDTTAPADFLLHCGDCEQDKPASAFPKNRARATGRGYYCRPCHSARVQAWKRANPEKAGRKPVAP